MATLDDAITIGRRERFLAVVSTVRADGTIQSSVVNAGVLAHPVTGEQVVGIVTYGRAKLANLRARPQGPPPAGWPGGQRRPAPPPGPRRIRADGTWPVMAT